VTFETAMAVEKAWTEGVASLGVIGDLKAAAVLIDQTRPTDKIGPFPSHPYADLFPLMDENSVEFAALESSILKDGLIQPIILYDDMILDGRNREAACKGARTTPRYAVYEGDNPLGFVISLNVKRRHLDEGQRGLIAARLANMRQGERNDLPLTSGRFEAISQAAAAIMLDVHVNTVTRAKAILDKAKPVVVHGVATGNVSITAAVEIMKLDLDDADLETLVTLPKRDVGSNIEMRKKAQRRNETVKREPPNEAQFFFNAVMALEPWLERDIGALIESMSGEERADVRRVIGGVDQQLRAKAA
jgi:hypothetical protein